jgi:hypothetical protein
MFVLLTFSTMARANGGTTFRLLIEDTTTGVQRVITDNVKFGGIFNPDGDQASSTLGTISFTSSIGNFSAIITATSTTAADGGGILTLNANVTNQTGVAGQFVAILEDVYGPNSDGPAASLTNTVSSTAVLSGSTLAVQSWLDPSGAVPSFGSNSGQVALTGAGMPSDNPYNDVGVGTIGVTTGATNSVFSEAAVQFTGAGGSANFTFTASDPGPATPTMPEPTSLMLLGSSLLAAGILRKTKKL